MSSMPGNAQQGFMLVSVALLLVFLAFLAYAGRRHDPMALLLAGAEGERSGARYLAQAAVAHADWAAQQAGCTGYVDTVGVGLGAGSYDFEYGTGGGSPVKVRGRGLLPDGSAVYAERAVTVYDYSNPTSLTLQPGALGWDTYISDASTDANFGDQNDLRLDDGGDNRRVLIAFDLSQVPAGGRIVSAALELYLETAGLSVFPEARVRYLSRDWLENGATWEEAHDDAFWNSPGGDYDPAVIASTPLSLLPGWQSWNVSQAVRAWRRDARPNDGFLIEGSGTTGIRFVSGDSSDETRHPRLVLSYACECATLCTTGAGTTTLVLSTDNLAVLGNESLQDGDLAEYEPGTGAAAVLFRESDEFDDNADIDAVHMLADGRIVLSTRGSASLGGSSFDDDDLVEYDPETQSSAIVLDGNDAFGSDEDIDAVHVLNDGHLVLSTEKGAVLGGVNVEAGDLAEYDPALDIAARVLEGSQTFTSGDENIDAVHVLTDGRYVLSTVDDANISGLDFGDDDLVLYDPLRDSAELVFDGGASFSSTSEQVDAVHEYRLHARPGELRLLPDADTYLDADRPDEALGGGAELELGDTRRLLVRFDLSGLGAGTAITAATLYLHAWPTSGSSFDIGVHRVNAAWDEATATWNSLAGGSFDAVPVAVGNFSLSAPAWIGWPLPGGLLQEWLDGVSENDGVLLQYTAAPGTELAAHSREFMSSLLRPRLLLEYTSP